MKKPSIRHLLSAASLILTLLAWSSVGSNAADTGHGASMLLQRGAVMSTPSANSPRATSVESAHGASYVQQLAGKTSAPAAATSQSAGRPTDVSHGAAYLVGISAGSTKAEVAPLK